MNEQIEKMRKLNNRIEELNQKELTICNVILAKQKELTNVREEINEIQKKINQTIFKGVPKELNEVEKIVYLFNIKKGVPLWKIADETSYTYGFIRQTKSRMLKKINKKD